MNRPPAISDPSPDVFTVAELAGVGTLYYVVGYSTRLAPRTPTVTVFNVEVASGPVHKILAEGLPLEAALAYASAAVVEECEAEGMNVR